MATMFLSLRGITKSYDGLNLAVKDIDLDVERGEFITLLGPSGSGKTTLLMLIAGFERATSGHIMLGGDSIDQLPPYARNIGVVFQNYALFPHMTVAENIRYPLRMRGLDSSAARDKIERVLTMVGLTALGARYPSQLSGGQQQRVALARTLVFQPDLVLLDEPLGALDKNLREQMQVELKRIHKELGVTMIYVTHDQTEAMTMSDRIAVMSAGRIEQLGSPTDVYFRPKTKFVASFVGDSNLFDGTVVAAPEGAIEVPGLGKVLTGRRDLASGHGVTVLMRPEIFRLSERDADGPEVVVQDSVNYGDSQLVFCKLGTTTLRARIPNVDSRPLVPGTRCRLNWARANVHVISNRESAS